MSVKQVTADLFDEAIMGGKVLVDCYADWCGPCQVLSPIIDELAEEVEGWKFCKLDVDMEQEIAERYDIMSIPTILLFVDGELRETLVGMQSKEELRKKLEEIQG